jgi:hypothetical protein
MAVTFGVSALLLGLLGLAQERRQLKVGKGGSPREEAVFTVAGKKITVAYGRPYKKGRQIFGGLVPFGQVWRTGADEATVLKTEADLMIDELHVPAGEYALFTIPNQNEWTLILNTVPNQWGAFKYDQSKDLGRVSMKVQKAKTPHEQVFIDIQPLSGSNAMLKIAWDDTEAVAPLMVH